MKNNHILQSLGHAVVVFLYITLVTLIMRSGEQLFAGEQNFWGPIVFLSLFVLSAAVMGALILGRPILLYLDGHKTAAVKFFGYTIAWIVAILAIILAVHLWR